MTRLCAILLACVAILLAVLAWTYFGKTAAEVVAEAAEDRAREFEAAAAVLDAERREAVEAADALTDALADSTAAWRGRMAAADTSLAEATERARNVSARLEARLDSVGVALLDSLNAESDARVQAVEVKLETETARADAEADRADAERRARLFAEGALAEQTSATREWRVASETKDAIIRSLKLQRNVTGGLTLASVGLNVVLLLGG